MKKRAVLYAVLFATAVVIAAPWLPAGAFRGPIERSLERSLQREVEIGDVEFTFFPTLIPSPGFSLKGVTIHEDPRAGIEPFMYMEEAGASIRVLPLFARRLELATLDLGAATVNLVKTDEGRWNFQYLLEKFAEAGSPLPALRIRTGRINFKFGDTKSAFYFNNADLDVSYETNGSMDLRFGGAPSRSDRVAQDFGRFFVRGSVSRGHEQLNFQVDLEQSPLEDTLRLVDPRGFGLHGTVAVHARLDGPPEALRIDADVAVNDVHRFDLLPKEGGGLKMTSTGTLNLRGEELEFSTASAAAAFSVSFHATQFLSHPQWEAAADLRDVRLANLFEIAKHMGATLPENLTIDGTVAGSVAYSEAKGVTGNLTLADASLRLPDAEPLLTPVAQVSIDGGSVTLETSKVEIGAQAAEVQGSVGLASPRALDLRISTRGLNVAAMRSFGLTAIPIIGETPQGSWAGWARYRGDGTAGEWTGESRLENARLHVDGISESVEIERANVRLTGRGVSLTGVHASTGGIPFTGAYAWDPRARRPHAFSAVIAEADAQQIQRLLAPALARDSGGFLARTLRLQSTPPIPAWIRSRRADGIVSIETLTAQEYSIRGLKARILWDGPQVRLTAAGGLIGPAAFSGDVTVDLSSPQPKYRYDGEITGVAYGGGTLDFFGLLETEGAGLALIANARGEGSLTGRGVEFGEAKLKDINACFVLSPAGAPRWKFTTVEVARDDDVLRGTGASQPDGSLVLEFPQGERLLSRADR